MPSAVTSTSQQDQCVAAAQPSSMLTVSPREGEVITWTVINSAPIGFEKYTPYMVALIELEDGLRLISQLVDADPGSSR